MSCPKVGTLLKLIFLTALVGLSFLFSSLCWHHIETDDSSKIIVATIILVIMYTLMIFELVNRTLAALIGAALSVAAHDCLIGFVSMDDIIKWEDLETLALLFGMMTIVGVLSDSGIFEFLAIYAYEKSAGRFWLLVTVMSFITGILSAFLDNVSTMLLLSPTLIKLSELEHIDPKYLLMIMVISSNIGGTATPVGDPPNLIIINDQLTVELGINFGSFTCYSAPCSIICWIAVSLYVKLVYVDKNSFRVETTNSLDTETESVVSDSIESRNPDGQLTRGFGIMNNIKLQLEQLDGDLVPIVNKLKIQVDDIVSGLETKSSKANPMLSLQIGHSTDRRDSRLSIGAIDGLKKVHRIRSKPLLFQSLIILFMTIVLFFLESLPNTNLSLGWISLFSGLSIMVVSSTTKISTVGNSNDHKDNFERIMDKIEWSTLVFFFGLFIVMEVMSKLGLILFLGNSITQMIDLIPEGPVRSIIAISTILWASGLASALIDNVPFTSMMIKVLGTFASDTGARDTNSLRVEPLIFALVFGACLGGNGTLIGASANLVTANISSRHGYPMTFNSFFKFAAPVTILTLVVANIYLVIVFVALGA